MRPAIFLCALLVLTPSTRAQQADAKTELPKVVLIGDSIRLGYAAFVAKRLEGKAAIVSVQDNGGDSANVLKNLEEWVLRERPDVVHLNCGLHDLKLDRKTKKHQVELPEYEANLRAIVERIRKQTKAALVFANTTPILDERHAKRGGTFDRFEADVRAYNAAALGVMKELNVPIHDLHWVVETGGPDRMLGKDGTHYTPEASQRLAEAVTDCVQRQLTIVRYRPLASPATGPRVAEAYRKTEAELDAKVPAAYKNAPIGALRIPETAAAWKQQRPEVLKAVVQALGDLPLRPSPPRARIVARELHPTFTLEKVAIENGVDGEVTALLLVPAKRQAQTPAILWLHSSTPDKTQIIIPRTNGGEESLGEVLVKAGYVVMSPDAYWHGDRVGTGPSGSAETLRTEQESLFKFHLWFGRTLWGMFVRDDQVALDYLCTRPEVDKTRIGATGMSMGSTRSWWLAAVDERIAAVVGVACLTRYQNLIAHGQLRQHGVYYWVNGLLKHFDTEGVLALIAPRPYLALTGDLDAGSPADGIKILEEKVGRIYQALGAPERFKNILYTNVGHTYTPEMRQETLAWFDRWLRPRAQSAKSEESVRVAGIVLKWIRGDKEANYRRAEPLIREAAAGGAKIVCTTECFLDGYAIADKSIPLDEYRALGEPIPAGSYFKRLTALAAELKIHLIAGMLEADGAERYNTAVLLGPDGSLLGKYRKQKLGHESVRNTPGSISSVFETPHGKIGVMICADRTEAGIVRRFCDNGADFLICPSGGMFGPKSNDPIVQARSKENGKHIIFVHPAEFLVTGRDGAILDRTILGDSLLIAPPEVGKDKDSQRVFYFDLP